MHIQKISSSIIATTKLPNKAAKNPVYIKKAEIDAFSKPYQSLNNILKKIKAYWLYVPQKPTLKTLDGKQVIADVIKPKKGSWYLECQGETVGTVLFSKDYAPIKGTNYPANYKNKPYLYINSLDSHKTYKGIGTALINAIIEESKRLGLEGRVCLNASTTNAKLGSPVPFYYKLGFECSDGEKQKLLDYCMKNQLPLPRECESATMFLPIKN